MNAPQTKPRSTKATCLVIAGVTVGVFLLLVLGVFLLVKSKLTDFDTYRDDMGIVPGLAVTDEDLRYSPGMDAVMWCRFTTKASDISDVFDPARVDTSEFRQADYRFRASGMSPSWWDADRHRLTGGEVQIGPDFMWVGWRDNGDGSLTVYVFWFEV